MRKYTVNVNGNAEFGRSQKTKSETEIFENIDQLDWYAYDDNFGTSEEKYLVRAIRELMNDLQEKWSDIYLLRNEKAVKIYSFDEGRAFEPDFILLANDKKVGSTSWQIFIEPKGSQFLDRIIPSKIVKKAGKRNSYCKLLKEMRQELCWTMNVIVSSVFLSLIMR